MFLYKSQCSYCKRVGLIHCCINCCTVITQNCTTLKPGFHIVTSNGVNSKENLLDTLDYIHRHGLQTNIAISLCTIRKDKPRLLKKIHAKNNIIKDVCIRNNLKWIDNSSLDETYLGAKSCI